MRKQNFSPVDEKNGFSIRRLSVLSSIRRHLHYLKTFRPQAIDLASSVSQLIACFGALDPFHILILVTRTDLSLCIILNMAQMVNPDNHRTNSSIEENSKSSNRSTKKDSVESRSSGKQKQNAKITRTPSIASLPELNQEVVNDGVEALSQIAGILRYAHRYKGFIEDVDAVHGRYIAQEAEIHSLQGKIDSMTFFAEKETQRLLEENRQYKLSERMFETDRANLNDQIARMDARLAEEKSKLETKATTELENAKRTLEENASSQIRKQAKKHERLVENLTKDLDDQTRANDTMRAETEEIREKLTKEVNELKCDRMAYRTRIFELERETNEMKALSPVTPQDPEF